jgi:hypothetical protein
MSSVTMPRRASLVAERRFYLGFAIAAMAAVLFGFARTFLLRHWFPEWAAAHGAPEPYFYFHGVVFFSWFVLLIVQPWLITARRVELHRRVGTFGAGLAAAMVVIGTYGALMAARRTTGFIDVPLPPLQFLIVPLRDLALFGVFVGLAVLRRRDAQVHKRLMLLATIAILDAAIVRWPLVMDIQLPEPWFNIADLISDGYLVALAAWDFASRGRLHPVTLWGGLALIVSQPLRAMLWGTGAWLAFAGWATGLLGN